LLLAESAAELPDSAVGWLLVSGWVACWCAWVVVAARQLELRAPNGERRGVFYKLGTCQLVTASSIFFNCRSRRSKAGGLSNSLSNGTVIILHEEY
jgi:hypothetical protein